jgi:hypothetical protein
MKHEPAAEKLNAGVLGAGSLQRKNQGSGENRWNFLAL